MRESSRGEQVQFPLTKLFEVDGSKRHAFPTQIGGLHCKGTVVCRSGHSNAYFFGFWKCPTLDLAPACEEC